MYIIKKLITKQVVLSTALIFFLLGCYSLLRLGFYISNIDSFEGINASETGISFIYGLRFDLAAIFITNSVIFFLICVPYSPIHKKWYKLTVLILFCVINILFIILNISDFGYYPVTQRRLLFEPFTMLPDIIRMIPSAISYHYWLFIIFLAGAVFFIFSAIKLFSRFGNIKIPEKKFFVHAVNFVILVLLTVTAIRGGFQLKPLRQANAFYSDNRALGYLTLNTTYNVVLSAFQDEIQEISFMPESNANNIVKDIIKDENEILLDSNYIFMRRKIPVGEQNKLNVVIFIMESWSAKFCNKITGKISYTPFFDSLSSSGLLFSNFFVNAQRSVEAVPSIIASVPPVSDIPIISSVAEMNNFRGLGSILKESGYTTSFFHGAATGSMGFDGFSKIAGFQNYYGKEDFPNLPSSSFDGAWGIYDEPFFLEAEKKLTGYEQPFCSIIFSLSSHDPYKIPDEHIAMFNNKDETDFERSIRYSDYCLKKFFNKASGESWFNNTLFVITSDHTLFNIRGDFYSTFHSLLFLYTPSGILKPGVNNKISSHADILPSILDILQLPVTHASMGVSVFSQNPQRYCFEKYGNCYCIINDEYVLLNDLEHTPALYKYKTDPGLKTNLNDSYKDLAEELNSKLMAYIETSTNALTKNKIYKE